LPITLFSGMPEFCLRRAAIQTNSCFGGCMPEGLDNLKHIVVLMMENRSFDHMLGYLNAQDPRIDGVDVTQKNADPSGTQSPVQPLAAPQGQLDPDPGHHFEDVDIQLFYGSQTNP